MPQFINLPLDFGDDRPLRKQKKQEEILSDLLELIVFTPRGSLNADPEFGFEYWNNEYANVQYRDFNNGQNSKENDENIVNKQECQDSIKESLEMYAPNLKVIDVALEITPAETDSKKGGNEGEKKKKIHSRSLVSISVDAYIREEDRNIPWHKDVVFLMEPTAKRLGK